MAHCEFGYANHKRIPNGTPVAYQTFNGRMVEGVIVSQGEPMFPRFQDMRVTGGNVPFFPEGKVVTISLDHTVIRGR